MAAITKPTKTPRWGDTNALIIEPPEAKKDAGWLFQEVPPSNFENWRTQLNGEWWKWIDERWADGPTNDVIAMLDPSGTNADPIIEADGLTALESNFIFRDGATDSTLKIAKDTQILSWLNGSNQSFSADENKMVVGRSDSDGIRMFGVGALKGITFDSNFNQLRYDINTDIFHFFCNSASSSFNIADDRIQAFQPMVVGAGTPQDAGDLVVQHGINAGGSAAVGTGQGVFTGTLNVGSDATPTAAVSKFLAQGMNIGAPANNAAVGSMYAQTGLRVGAGTTHPAAGVGIFGLGMVVGGDFAPSDYSIHCKDGNFAMTFPDFGDPAINFDGAGDAIVYDRSANEYLFKIGNTNELRLSSTEMRPSAALGVTLGSNTFYYGTAYAAEFYPKRGFNNDPPVNRFASSVNNAICMRGRATSGGTLAAQVWNVQAVSHPFTGTYEFDPYDNLISTAMVVGGAQRYLAGPYICSCEWNNPAGEVGLRLEDDAGVARNDDCGFFAWG